MKILFIASSRKGKGISPFIKRQGESLISHGVDVNYFLMQGAGLKNYIKSLFTLRNYLNINNFDLVHAHYGLTGIITLLAKPKRLKIVLSYMGDDLYGTFDVDSKLTTKGRVNVLLSKIFTPFYDFIIVKSERMLGDIKSKYHSKCMVIPNGVDLKEFYPTTYSISKKELNLDDRFNILFLGSSIDPRKNHQLIQELEEYFQDYPDVRFVKPYPINSNKVPVYLNAVDLLLHPSKMEGSPNLVKEAMACACPIISTDVGDVNWLFEKTDGCFIADDSPSSFIEAIKTVLNVENKRTNGFDRIVKMGLDTNTVSQRIISIYKSLQKRD